MKYLATVCLIGIMFTSLGQQNSSGRNRKLSDAEIAELVIKYKSDIRGPYRDIRWFCKDGTTVAPKERCPEPGVQRARYRDEVLALAQANGIYFGQILSTTPVEDFWDKENHHSRIKQYQLEQFLRANDDGWINRKAQYYRGAYQVEDEEAWGIQFYGWLLEDRKRFANQYFLVRLTAKDIPHAAESNVALRVRATSKEISDQYAPFMDLRVKLHGQPEKADIAKVKEFRTRNKSKLSTDLDKKFEVLLADMEVLYKPTDIRDFNTYLTKLPAGTTIHSAFKTFVEDYDKATKAEKKSEQIADLLLNIRKEITSPMKASARLSLIDASNRLETLLIQDASSWKPTTLKEMMAKVHTLTKAAAGLGYLEVWEWNQISEKLSPPSSSDMDLASLSTYVDNGRRVVEWGTGMIRATYTDVVNLYAGFEPRSDGFIDDKVRASILLQLGSTASALGDVFSDKAGFANNLMGINNQSAARGLNPGYAMGELVVTTQNPEDIEVSSDKIYVFNRPPADLKPVAGIATVTEGNLVSHVQLLARNLGIPNAVVSMNNLTQLLPYHGQTVFYAVSNRGTVVLKPASDMTTEERALFSKKVRNEEKISVPVEQIVLNKTEVLDLRTVNAASSGKICGPKAANLGQLKEMFPENVVNGLVIPFSIFKAHFDQPMPGQNMSYWTFLNETFDRAEQMSAASTPESEIERFVLDRLQTLRDAIKNISLKASFEKDLREKFKEVFGTELGKTPVFIRSDTNMEDLKDFTGAGLNLTLFNVLSADKILQGIKDVWASPYTERSYKWRQKYLLNPENVFPSILIIPSVNADCSGVLITKGVSNGNVSDNTVAFNRGVGGAVEGQSSETWLLTSGGEDILLSPAREPDFMSIPVTGGTVKLSTTFEERILTDTRLTELRNMAGDLGQKLKKIDMKGPYDVELGFTGDKIWLFQVRPFVENKRAAASDYLRSITPKLDESKKVNLDTTL